MLILISNSPPATARSRPRPRSKAADRSVRPTQELLQFRDSHFQLKLPLRVRIVHAAYDHRLAQQGQSAGINLELPNHWVACLMVGNREVADLGSYRQGDALGSLSYSAPDTCAHVYVLILALP